MTGSEHPTPCEIVERGAWFLDFDATRVGIAATPDGITVPPARPLLLARLSEPSGGASALLSHGFTLHVKSRPEALAGAADALDDPAAMRARREVLAAEANS